MAIDWRTNRYEVVETDSSTYADNHIVEILLLADAQELETALYDALWRIAIAVADAVGE